MSDLNCASRSRATIEWFDDLALGARFRSADKLVTREEIKRFAWEFDPQPYHLDEAAADQSAFKGLAASGWHTAAISMRLTVELRPFGPHPLLGLGVDELRWLAPVRPDDVLHLEGEVTELSRKELFGSNGRRSTNAASRFTPSRRSRSCRAAPQSSLEKCPWPPRNAR